MKKWFTGIVIALGIGFALIGLLFTAVFIAMHFGLLNVRGSISERNKFFATGATSSAPVIPAQPCDTAGVTVCAWNETPEWDVVKGGLTKDAAIISRVSNETGISGRMMAAVVIPEQIRFFTSEREVFKRYFEPLKILGSLSQFSLGVSGIKQDTALQVEQYANDPSSPFYPGPEAATLLAYPSTVTDRGAELYRRLTDDKNHYYSYLYTALYIKEVEAQWAKAGYDIRNNPEAVVTLFNIGFSKSAPNPSPVAGGAPITVGGTTYAFGALGAAFYSSNELTDILPQ